ncbi:MAG: lamin tail domain-containing protein [Myxococcota bacterium]
MLFLLTLLSAHADSLSEGDVIITELMIAPSAVTWYRGQWFELTNTTDDDIELKGLEVSNHLGESVTVSASLTVEAGEAVVFAVRDDIRINGGVLVDRRYSLLDLSLKARNGALTLSMDGDEIDHVSWSVAPSGASWQLSPEAFDGDGEGFGAWCESIARFGDGDYGSPGATNDGCDEDDADEDGASAAEDCDDEDSDRYPDADEVCDGIDNDCDGIADGDPVDGTTYYADVDYDLYGDPDAAVVACVRPWRHRTNGRDCDDSDSSITIECEADETERCAEDEKQRFYADVDYDLYGDPDTSVWACERPRGWRRNGLDCDDRDATRTVDCDAACQPALVTIQAETVLAIDESDGSDEEFAETGSGVKPNSVAVRFDGRMIAQKNDWTLYEVDLCEETFTKLGDHDGGDLCGIAFDNRGRLIGLSRTDDALVEVDLDTLEVTTLTELDWNVGSCGMAHDPKTDTLYGADAKSSTIFAIDPYTMEIEETLELEMGDARTVGLAWNTAEETLRVSLDDTLFAIDMIEGTIDDGVELEASKVDDLTYLRSCDCQEDCAVSRWVPEDEDDEDEDDEDEDDEDEEIEACDPPSGYVLAEEDDDEDGDEDEDD